MACLWSFYIFLRFSTRPRTICGAGAFACQLVMFYRRRLPHWHPDLTDPTFLFVTWRLAGSIPRARLPQPHAGAPLSAGRAFLVLDRKVDKAAFGPVWLRDARVARVVADALMYGESGRHLYHLRAWGDQPGVIIVNNHAQPGACPAAAQDLTTGDSALVERLHRATSQPDSWPNGGGLLAG